MEFPLENTNPESDQSNKSENFTSIFQQVFLNTSNNGIKENIEEEDKNRFFHKEFTKTKESTTTPFVNIIPFLFVVSKDESEDFIRKKRGRKAVVNEDENENENQPKKNHNKFDTDNILTKIKSRLIQAIINFLNNTLEEESKCMQIKDRKRKIPIRKESFLKINQQIISNTTVQYNLDLLNKTLRDIFSEPVSLKLKDHSVHGLNYNKNFIKKIEGDENRKKTNEILNMTLLQCLEHFRNSKSYEILTGLEREYQNVIDEMKKTEEEDYVRNFMSYLNHFEELYKQKKQSF